MAKSALTSLADHKEPRDVDVALVLLFMVACYGQLFTQALHARFNPRVDLNVS